MTTAALVRANVREREASTLIKEFEVPSYALRPVAAPSKMPKDKVGREIATLFIGHPKIELQYRDVNLDKMSHKSKVNLLASIKESLGIRPICTRRLGFAGFD